MCRTARLMAACTAVAAIATGCGGRERLEPLAVDSPSPRGRWRIEMLLRTGGRREDAWVARVWGRAKKPTDVVLPSYASNEDDRTVSRRKPKLVWDPSEDRVLVETIRSAFLVLYTPPSDPPFVCEHRLVDPMDAYLALSRTPTLARLEEEILTEDDKPHDADEQEYVLRRLERAGATSSAAHVLLPAVIHSSKGIDRARVLRLAVARLRPDAGLPAPVRDSELARLRTVLDDFLVKTDRDNAIRGARVIDLLGALPREDSERKVVPALEAAVARTSTATGTAKVIDAIGPLAWLAGKWRIQEAAAALGRAVAARDEIPWKSRVARNLALWAATQLGSEEALLAALPLVDDPAAWATGGTRGEVPPDGEAAASPRWADETPLGVVFAWAAARLREARAIPPLRAVLGRTDVPPGSAAAAARALLALDATLARAVIQASTALDERAKQDLLR